VDHLLEPRALFRAQFHDILLDRDLLDGHEATPSFRYGAIESEILLSVNDGGQ
jgi:hypothetical protein